MITESDKLTERDILVHMKMGRDKIHKFYIYYEYTNALLSHLSLSLSACADKKHTKSAPPLIICQGMAV